MPHRRQGRVMPNGHSVRSQSEAALCEYLAGSSVAHEHWTLNFEVPTGPREWHPFTPSIVLTDLKCDDRIVIVEPVDSIQIGGGVRRLQSFRKRHGSDYFVIVITRRALYHRIPEDARDAIFPVEDLDGLGDYLQANGKAAPATPPG